MGFLITQEMEDLALILVDPIIAGLSSSPEGTSRGVSILAKYGVFGGVISAGLEIERLDPVMSNGHDYAIKIGGVVVQTATTAGLNMSHLSVKFPFAISSIFLRKNNIFKTLDGMSRPVTV